MTQVRKIINRCFHLLLLAGLGLLMEVGIVQAQSSDLMLEVQLDDRLTEAQRLDLNRLGVDTQGRGASLIEVTLENTNQNRELNDLYLYIRIEASGVGTIAELHQRQGDPFSLRPGQIVIADNNQLSDGLPGVPEPIRFEDAGLTPDGEQFINELEGFRLPRRNFTVTLGIYKGANRENVYDEELAKVSKSFGNQALGGEDLSIHLMSPGQELGGDGFVTTTRPVFNWEGDQADRYRLIVVEDTGDDPESLIQNAIATEPVIGGGGFGDYLDYEMVDALISDATHFTYPVADVQNLQEGQRYFWQVFTLINTADGEISIPSDIWEFTIVDPGDQVVEEMEAEVEEVLVELLSEQQLEELEAGGFSLEAMELNGQRYSGPEIRQMLQQLVERKREGEITFSN